MLERQEFEGGRGRDAAECWRGGGSGVLPIPGTQKQALDAAAAAPAAAWSTYPGCCS